MSRIINETELKNLSLKSLTELTVDKPVNFYFYNGKFTQCRVKEVFVSENGTICFLTYANIKVLLCTVKSIEITDTNDYPKILI